MGIDNVTTRTTSYAPVRKVHPKKDSPDDPPRDKNQRDKAPGQDPVTKKSAEEAEEGPVEGPVQGRIDERI